MRTTTELITDFEVAPAYTVAVSGRNKWYNNLRYLAAGTFFGIVLVKAEVISWFRIQEMFRLQSFHMYGVLGSAVAVGMISVLLIKKFNIKTISGEKIVIYPKKFNKGQIYGGLLFGFGWAIRAHVPVRYSCRSAPAQLW